MGQQRFVSPPLLKAMRELKTYLGERGYVPCPIEGKYRVSKYDFVALPKQGFGRVLLPPLLFRYHTEGLHRWYFEVRFDYPNGNTLEIKKYLHQHKKTFGRTIWYPGDVGSGEFWWKKYTSPKTREKLGVN